MLINEVDKMEIKLALDGLPNGFWELWTSNSYNRITATGGADGGALSAQSNHHLSMNRDQLLSLCLLVNRLRLRFEQENNHE